MVRPASSLRSTVPLVIRAPVPELGEALDQPLHLSGHRGQVLHRLLLELGVPHVHPHVLDDELERREVVLEVVEDQVAPLGQKLHLPRLGQLLGQLHRPHHRPDLSRHAVQEVEVLEAEAVVGMAALQPHDSPKLLPDQERRHHLARGVLQPLPVFDVDRDVVEIVGLALEKQRMALSEQPLDEGAPVEEHGFGIALSLPHERTEPVAVPIHAWSP